jgi:hypothetical protein
LEFLGDREEIFLRGAREGVKRNGGSGEEGLVSPDVHQILAIHPRDLER